jgi:hypothetical protein
MQELTKSESPRAVVVAKNGPLAHMHEDVNLQELTDISTMMGDYINNQSDIVRQAVIARVNRNPGLLARLFPNKFEKEDRRIALDRMTTMYEKEKQLLEVFTAVKLQIARRQGDALIASVGMALQGKLAAFAMRKIDDLSETFGDSRQRFLARMKPQIEDLENYKDFPELYDSARISIRNEIKTYFAGIDELLGGFISALQCKIAG